MVIRAAVTKYTKPKNLNVWINPAAVAMASSSAQLGNATRYMTRRLSNESCDLYADVERSLHLRTMVENSPVASCKSSSRNSSRDRGGRYSPRRSRIGLELVQNVNEGRISPSINLDGTSKSNAHGASIVATESNAITDYVNEVSVETDPDAPQTRTGSRIYHRPSLLREELSCKSELVDKCMESSCTRSISPKCSTITKVDPTAVQDVSERPERSQRSKSREKYLSERRERSQDMSNSRNSRKHTSRSQTDQTTDESDKHKSSSSRSRRPSTQHSERALHQRSRTKSLSPNPRQKSATQPDVLRSVDRKHRNHASRQGTSQVMTKGSSSRSAADLRSSEKRRKSEAKRNKKNGEKSSKEKIDRREVMEKPALTTRTWRAKLAERFGRQPLTTTPMMSTNHRICDRVPTLVICSDDFAQHIKDDLTAIP